jgi:hypothetical protein
MVRPTRGRFGGGGPGDQERDIMMQMMMGNMLIMRNDEAERAAKAREDAMLQAALEASCRDAGVNDIDNMSYE